MQIDGTFAVVTGIELEVGGASDGRGIYCRYSPFWHLLGNQRFSIFHYTVIHDCQ